MKTKLLGIILLSSLVLGGTSSYLTTSPSYALPIEQVSNPRKDAGRWVTDEAKILSQSAIEQLDRSIAKLEAKTGIEIAVVTVPDISPHTSVKDYATELYNRWGIGKKGKDNGILFLVSVNDRRVEIETGYGLEGNLPDAKVGNILNTYVVPYFKQGNYEKGILLGTQAIIGNLTQAAEEDISTPIESNDTDSLLVFIIVGGLFAIIGVVFAFSGVFALIGDVFATIGAAFALIGETAIYLKNRKRLSPQGRSKGRSLKEKNRFYCAKCGTLMEELPRTTLEEKLTYPQKVAQRIQSSDYRGWQCPNCSQQTEDRGFHLRHYLLNYDYDLCPNCDEYTLIKEVNVLEEATTYADGIQQIILDCECCDYHEDHEKRIPMIRPTVVTSSSSSLGSSWGGSSSSSSSGSDFGGGSSGGGGAGSSW